ncbi:MAG: glycosyltransferase family 4 protein [Porticoccaceae bacterium]
MTRVAHALPWYAPESWGGTEQYVAALAASLQARGCTSVVMAPSRLAEVERYAHAGLTVLRWRVDGGAGAGGFVDCLRESGAEVLHLHGWTPLCGAAELAEAAAQGVATVVTVHVPSLVCATGTMLHLGSRPCDRVDSPGRCARCWLQSHAVPAPLALALAALPLPLSAGLLRAVPGRLRHLPGAHAAMQERKTGALSGLATADRVVAVCSWLHRALLALGTDAGRTVLVRQALDADWLGHLADVQTPEVDSENLQLLFVGRWDRVKGLHVLIAALLALGKASPFRLRVIMAGPSEVGEPGYRKEILQMIDGDPRFEIVQSLPRDQLAVAMASAQVLVIPSQWLETGPLVALEARALGTFVLASDIGGLAENLRGDPGAALVRFDDVGAWSEALQGLVQGRDAVRRVPGASPVRSSDDLAGEMLDVYADAIASSGLRKSA